MIKGKWKLLICITFVACAIFMASNSLFAAINMEYYNQNVKDNTVVESNLDNKIKSSVLTDALGSMIYAIGSLFEWVLGGVFKIITGSNIFPWADAILFNAIPFLDINVFNPSGSSLVALIQEFISGTYYTLLALASTFFGIAVMVSAIRLVLTAIAEDKARYKKAIVDWLLGLVMLWGIHFFISFVLYLNEELVKAASMIATTTLEEAEDEIIKLGNTSEYDTQIVLNFVNLMENGNTTLGDIMGGLLLALGALLIAAVVISAVITGGLSLAGIFALASGVGLIGYSGYEIGNSITEELERELTAMGKRLTYEQRQKAIDDGPDQDEEGYEEMKEWLVSTEDTFSYVDQDGKTKTVTYSPVKIASSLLNTDAYYDTYLEGIVLDGAVFTKGKSGSPSMVKGLFYDCQQIVGRMKVCTDDVCDDVDEAAINGDEVLSISYYKSMLAIWNGIPQKDRIIKGNEANYDPELYQLYSDYVTIFDAYVIGKAEVVKQNIITNLASYFKETATTVSDTGWKANKKSVQNSLMYAILVVQSVIFFIAYSKRLFYVILLILMAPIVVVFDFFMKTSK